MSSEQKNVSNSLRYLKARLQPFKRPEFLVTATILSAVSVFAWQYLQDPQWIEKLSQVPESAVDSSNPDSVANDSELSEELPEGDLQLIDTGTLSAIDPNNPTQTEDSENESEGKSSQDKAGNKGQENSNKNSFKEALEALSDPNAFGSLLPTVRGQNDSNPVAGNSSSGSSSLFNVPQFGGLGNDNKNQANQGSALQQAIQQLELTKNSIQQSENNTNSPVQGSQVNSYPGQSQSQQPVFSNQGRSYSNYQAPTNNYNNYSNYNYSNPPTYNYSGQSQPVNLAPVPTNLTPVVPVPNNTSTYNYGTRQAAPPVYSQPQTIPNSTFNNNNQFNQGLQTNPRSVTPRPIPGRYIGGGQINNFSNP
ncbi:MAG: hypothetical protein WA865_02040 [Spirulinaceae cyanobacterium]